MTDEPKSGQTRRSDRGIELVDERGRPIARRGGTNYWLLEVEPCVKCGHEHRGHYGQQSCRRHNAKRDELGRLQPCQRNRKRGYSLCGRHLQVTPNPSPADYDGPQAQRVMTEIEQSASMFGIARHIDPQQGLIESYWRSAGLVAELEKRCAELSDRDVVFGVITERVEVERSIDIDGNPIRDSLTGVEMFTEKRKVTHGARPHVLVRLFNEERDRFEKLGLEIMKLGLEVMRDQYIAAQVDLFASVLVPADLSDDQRRIIAEGLRKFGTPAAIRATASVDAQSD